MLISNVILIISVVSALISLVIGILGYLLPLYMTQKYSLSPNSSIGIIGGADGPTAIFVTCELSNSLLLAAVFFLIAVLGVVCQFFIRRFKN